MGFICDCVGSYSSNCFWRLCPGDCREGKRAASDNGQRLNHSLIVQTVAVLLLSTCNSPVFKLLNETEVDKRPYIENLCQVLFRSTDVLKLSLVIPLGGAN